MAATEGASDRSNTKSTAPYTWKSGSLSNHRQFVVAVEGRRRRELPFERRRTLTPVVGPDPAAGDQRIEYDEDKEQGRGEGDVGTDRRHHVPAGESIRVIRDP